MGSIETFTIDFDAVNIVTSGSGSDVTTEQVKNYKVYDTPTGLEIDVTTVAVTVNGTKIASSAFTAAKDANGKLTVTIPWVDEDGNALYEPTGNETTKIPVVVSYDATVLASAATAVAPNKVDVKYTNEDNTEREVGSSETNTYTYKFKLLKTDGTNALAGAEFELYYAGEDGEATGDALTFTVADGKYRFDPAGTTTHIAPDGEDASALVIGLDDASYVLVEVVVPEGFNKAADQPVTGLSRVDVADASATEITVINNKGTELPSTGGMGTTILYTVGGILIAAGGIWLVTKKRLSAME